MKTSKTVILFLVLTLVLAINGLFCASTAKADHQVQSCGKLLGQ